MNFFVLNSDYENYGEATNRKFSKMKYKFLTARCGFLVGIAYSIQVNAATFSDTVIGVDTPTLTIAPADTYNSTAWEALIIQSSATLGVLDNQGTITSSTAPAVLIDSSTITTIENGSNSNTAATISGTMGIRNWGSIGTINNYGVVQGVDPTSTDSAGIQNYGGSSTIGTINNYGIIRGTTSGSKGINNIGGSITSINNSGTISSTGLNGYALYNNGGVISTVLNSGTISASGAGSSYGIYNYVSGGATYISTIGEITNTSTGTVSGTLAGIYNKNKLISSIANAGVISATALGSSGVVNNSGAISDLNNSNAITGAAYGIQNSTGATISNLDNSGAITGTSAYGIYNAGTINALSNTGTISGFNGSPGLNNGGTITLLTNTGTIAGGITNTGSGSIDTLNNSQGGINGMAYTGKLPNFYNVIINSLSSFGKLNGIGTASAPTATMTFGVSSSSSLAAGSYAEVLAGVNRQWLNASSLTGTVGTSYSWSLVEETANLTVWDLLVISLAPSGPSAADTQDALKQSAAALRSVFNYQSTLVNNSLNYDCTVFAENGVCVSGGGRFAMTNNITGEQMSTLLVASYKTKPNMRVGAFIDQNASTPSAAGISVDKAPMYGVFGVWNQNTDLSGYEVRLSSSWSEQSITQTRNVVGTSEAGVGTAGLKSQALSGVVSYAMALPETSWIAAPYAGVRKTKVSRGGYTETSAVTTPLTYGDLNQDITTALAGVRMSKKYGNDLYVTASAGVEQNIGSNISTLDASGVTGLTATDFSANYAKTRPVASVGMSYAVAKDQRISFSAMYRKEAFQSAGSTTGLLMYQVGL